MIKKICLIIFLTLLVFSCGKKNDPIYKEKTRKVDHTEIKIIVWDIKTKTYLLKV